MFQNKITYLFTKKKISLIVFSIKNISTPSPANICCSKYRLYIKIKYEYKLMSSDKKIINKSEKEKRELNRLKKVENEIQQVFLVNLK